MPKSAQIKVLIAHSNPLISAGLSATLGRQVDFGVAAHRDELCVLPTETPPLFPADIIVADYNSGLQFAASFHRVVILTHIDSEARICHALEQGARGYLLLAAGRSEACGRLGMSALHSTLRAGSPVSHR